jgi:drug/metabolite transporter (DMT)-like permease
MRKRLTRIDPFSVGKVLALIYGIGAAIAVLVSLFIILIMRDRGIDGTHMLLFPLIYALGGFVGGIIFALLYNFAANLVGGIDFELKDDDQSPTVS